MNKASRKPRFVWIIVTINGMSGEGPFRTQEEAERFAANEFAQRTHCIRVPASAVKPIKAVQDVAFLFS